MAETDDLFSRGQSQYARGELSPALESFAQALALSPSSAVAHSNLLLGLNYQLEYDRATLYDMHRQFDALYGVLPGVKVASHTTTPEPERRIRIGYVSPDLRSHSVAFFIAPVLAHHRPQNVEVFAYYNHPQKDQISEKIRQICHHWRDIAHMPDDKVANQIRQDKIDILIDLAGHSARNRLPVFTYKPAPVQVTWLGYPNTTGLSCIDYRLTDSYVDPAGQSEQYHSETLFRLPNTFICYSPLRHCPDPGLPPVNKNGFITFGSLNNFAKINPAVIDLWIRLLKEISNSRLVLIYNNPDHSWVNNVVESATCAAEVPFACIRALSNLEYAKQAFSKAGLDTDRVLIRGRTPTDELHLQLYQQIDIALDPFPYNGTTTTMESLWMGVPVITLQGTTHASRVSADLLNCLGQTKLIAQSEEHYLEIARIFSTDIYKLTSFRKNARGLMHNSPLMNPRQFTDELESAYRDMWRNWCTQHIFEL